MYSFFDKWQFIDQCILMFLVSRCCKLIFVMSTIFWKMKISRGFGQNCDVTKKHLKSTKLLKSELSTAYYL